MEQGNKGRELFESVGNGKGERLPALHARETCVAKGRFVALSTFVFFRPLHRHLSAATIGRRIRFLRLQTFQVSFSSCSMVAYCSCTGLLCNFFAFFIFSGLLLFDVFVEVLRVEFQVLFGFLLCNLIVFCVRVLILPCFEVTRGRDRILLIGVRFCMFRDFVVR